MADWIKMRNNLWDDPRISQLCEMTGQQEATIIGSLYWLWATAGRHTEDGILRGLSPGAIDRKTGVEKLASSMIEIGWLGEHQDGMEIIRWNEHCAASVKRTRSSLARTDDVPDCPHQEILDLYEEILPELPQPRNWEGQRMNNMRARWRWVLTATKRKSGERYATTIEEGIDFFKRMFEYIRKCPRLMGAMGGWACDLTWLVKAENFDKVLAGNYEMQNKCQ